MTKKNTKKFIAIIKKFAAWAEEPFFNTKSKTKKFIFLVNSLVNWAVETDKDVPVQEISDGYHTFNELYEFRKHYNAALFNEWFKQGIYQVHKSKRHPDGELCFGGGWFIVVAILPTGQISNHYKMEDWDLFCIEETVVPKVEYDNHTPADVLLRLSSLYKQ